MKNLVEKENLDIVKIVQVLTQDMDFDDEYIANANTAMNYTQRSNYPLCNQLSGRNQHNILRNSL